jgi:hypothetical protein
MNTPASLAAEMFSKDVADLALASGDDLSDCILELCERRGIDLADAPMLLTEQLMERLTEEAKGKHLLKKES